MRRKLFIYSVIVFLFLISSVVQMTSVHGSFASAAYKTWPPDYFYFIFGVSILLTFSFLLGFLAAFNKELIEESVFLSRFLTAYSLIGSTLMAIVINQQIWIFKNMFGNSSSHLLAILTARYNSLVYADLLLSIVVIIGLLVFFFNLVFYEFKKN